MNTMNQFDLKPDLLAAAACMLPGDRGALSPLEEFGVGKLTQKSIQSLKKTGLITTSGQLEERFQQTLDDLLDPLHLFSIDLLKEDGVVNYSQYSKTLQDNAIAIRTSADNLAIQPGEVFSDAMQDIGNHLLCNQSTGGEFTQILPLEYAWIFFAALDLDRQTQPTAKKSKAKENPKSLVKALEPSQIKKALTSFSDSQNWLWLSSLSIISGSSPDREIDIESGLSWLVKTGLLAEKSGNYQLTNDYTETNRNLLQSFSIMNLLSAQKLSVVQVENQKLVCISTNNSVYALAFREGEEFIQYMKLFPDTLLNAINCLLREPLLLFRAFDLKTAESPSITCPVCGEPQLLNSKFCSDCGASLSIMPTPEGTLPDTLQAQPNAKGTVREKLSRGTPEPIEEPQEDIAPPKRKGVRWWLIVLILLILTLVLCRIFTFFNPITIRL
jgi:hypothetical protein